MPDEYTREEIRDAVWQATLGVPCDALARGWGRHSASSVHMMLLGTAGDDGITHTSPLMDEVAAELDKEERFTGWREDILSRDRPTLWDSEWRPGEVTGTFG
jgi:hypothetical protein